MSAAIDWSGLMRVGLRGLGLAPDAFWRLTPVELRIMVGAQSAAPPLTRSRLAELAAAFPDARKGQDNGGDRDVAGSGDGA